MTSATGHLARDAFSSFDLNRFRDSFAAALREIHRLLRAFFVVIVLNCFNLYPLSNQVLVA